MAVTAASLRVAHPEFTDTPDAVVNAAIADAVLRCDSSVLGDDLVDLAVTWLACYLIATSPYSRDKRRQEGSAEGYLYEFERIARAAGRAYRVIV